MLDSLRLPVLCGLLAALLASPLAAQEAQGETVTPSDAELALTLAVPTLEAAPAAGDGSITGLVFDEATGKEMLGVEATLIAADGTELAKSTSDATGAFQLDAVPAGTYSIRFEKPGYGTRRLTELTVVAGRPTPQNIALAPESASGAAGGVEEIVITGTYKAPLADRPNADEFINTLDTAEIGKFAASDIGDAIKRIPGINVVEGQFAIIRGLEDRYSSTLYNSAPVPSPDPNTQSVQLDLFPSEIANNLVVAKTFAADLPSNSAGGSINILTNGFEGENQVKLSLGSGFNESSARRFQKLRHGSPIGTQSSGADTIESDLGLSFSGSRELAEHELRAKGALSREVDYDTKTGTQQGREPRPAQFRLFPTPAVIRSGDLALGELGLTGGKFDLEDSSRVEQLTGFFSLGVDLDQEGDHTLDFSTFYTRKRERAVQLREHGFLPGFDYAALAAKQLNGDQIDRNSDFDGFATLSSWIARSVRADANDQPSRGPLWSTSFSDSRSFERDRDLIVYQVNGDHRFEKLADLHVTWAANHATTHQDESYFATRFFFEPADPNVIPTQFPNTPSVPGRFATTTVSNSSANVDETQNFVRLDAELELQPFEWLTLTPSSGIWFERSNRDVGASFLQNPRTAAGSQFAILGDTSLELGEAIPSTLATGANGDFAGLRRTRSSGDREILAFGFSLKGTIREKVDLLAGVRREHIQIASHNDPFTGELAFDGSPGIFPTKYLMFDRLDNPARSEVATAPLPTATFNDQLLGISVPVVGGVVDLVDRSTLERFVNGDIDEVRVLPTAGLTWRPLDGMNVRFAYSQTAARPSFREIGYYVTVESGSDDLVVGNPQLRLSDVESWDGRVEYLFGVGELAAVSVFFKRIDHPIESIVIRDPTNFEGSSAALYRTFFNNQNQADLKGVELEGRKAFDVLGVDALQYLSLGVNFTYIDAAVDRSPIELARASAFFGTAPGDVEKFSKLKKSRRLFSQPKWIANADLTFDDPDTNTKITLAVSALSDVLDAAGSATLNPNGESVSLTLDRYVAAFYQLDLIASQGWTFHFMPGAFTLKASVKNLTDSERKLVWDPSQTVHEVAERNYRLGRDVSISLSYDHAF